MNGSPTSADFISRIDDPSLLKAASQLHTLQVNITKGCNLACEHCHLSAGPGRIEMMPREVMQAALTVFAREGFSMLDITGGEPELNPDYEWLVREGSAVADTVITRTNLAILADSAYQHLPRLWADLGIVVMGSMPCYTQENVDSQKGNGTFDKDILALRALNAVGYGVDAGLELNLVYNPLGAYLPALQEELEADYRRALRERRGVEFSHLLTITNNPIGRFGEMLQAEGTLDDYRQLLSDAFNPATLAGMMCRDQLSVDCDGSLYDCDFNLALGLGIQAKETTTIFDVLSTGLPAGRPIMFADHCYACTAGAGSSCGGSTA